MLSYKYIRKFVENTIEEYNLELHHYTYKDFYMTMYDISPTRYFSITLYRGSESSVSIDILGHIYHLLWPLSEKDFRDMSLHCRRRDIRGINALKIFLNAIIDYNKNIFKIKYNFR